MDLKIYVGFIAYDRISIVQSIEGRFEESVIAYLFLINIFPILIIPMVWIETGKFTEVLNNWTEFEVIMEFGIWNLVESNVYSDNARFLEENLSLKSQ